MRRKFLIIIMVALFILFIGVFVKKIYLDKADILKSEVETVLEDINDLSGKAGRYKVSSTGELAISANYRGAHGENFPHDFTFNYVLENNTLYMENEDGYNSLKLDKDLMGFIKGIKKSLDESKVVILDNSINFMKSVINIDTSYINEVYNTNFKEIKATVYFENFLSKNVDKMVIEIDDIVITKIGKSYTIEVDDNTIKYNSNSSGYSLTINDNIKMNVFNETTNDRYTLVVDSYVYSFTVTNDSIDFVASSSASIYNSINVIVSYEDYELLLTEELDIEENPITRYFSAVK